MTIGTMKIADKVCNVIFHEGRTYIQPQFSCIIKGCVEKVTEAANGWDLLILQEAYHTVGFWITLSYDDTDMFDLEEPEEGMYLGFSVRHERRLETNAIPYYLEDVDFCDDFYLDRTVFANYCPIE